MLNSGRRQVLAGVFPPMLRRPLDTGLPRAFTPELYKQKCSALFEHVYESTQNYFPINRYSPLAAVCRTAGAAIQGVPESLVIATGVTGVAVIGAYGAYCEAYWRSVRTRSAAGGPAGTVEVHLFRRIKLPIETLKRALSIQQPMSELILTGHKTEEYRSRRTLIRERVYLYAGKKFKTDFPGFSGAKAALLPRGVIVGSVEVAGCHEDDEEENCFVWELKDPVRYPKPLVPQGVPQPGFWWPKF